MSISGIDSGLLSSLNTFNLKDMLRGKSEKSFDESTALENSLTDGVSVAQNVPATISASQQNLMAGNFASSDRDQSKYITGTLKGFVGNAKLKTQAQNQAVSILSAVKTMYEGAETPGERYKAIKWAEKHMALNQSREVGNAAEEGHLKEAKLDIEKVAQEATAPKDANGNPIPDVTATDSGAAPIAAPAPAPAPAPEVEPVDVAAGDGATPEVAVPEVASSPTAPAPQVSIDITI